MNKEQKREYERKRYYKRKEQGYYELQKQIKKEQRELFLKTPPKEILELLGEK